MVYGAIGRWLLHDLRNPVQALALVAELFSDEPGAARDPTLVTTLIETSGHLARTLDLQDRVLRRLPTPAEPRPVPLGPLLEFFHDLHATRHSAVTLTIDAGGPDLPAVAADEPALEHAILNLLVNAYEAVGERVEGQIGIAATRVGDWVDIVVQDNGPGLPATVASHLFEPFTTTKPGGHPFNGLGLSVARLLVERMNGELTLEPSAVGTRARIRLPAWGND